MRSGLKGRVSKDGDVPVAILRDARKSALLRMRLSRLYRLPNSFSISLSFSST
jgi:hypothetical protein